MFGRYLLNVYLPLEYLGLKFLYLKHMQGYPAIRPELDLVDQEDQFTHELSLEDEIDPETTLGIPSNYLLSFIL